MKVIDNFQKIGQALHFDSEDQFYFIQILQRKKDNPVFPQNNRLVKYYVVRSVDYFWHIEPEVKAICEATTARAYISLNRRSFKKCTLEALTEIARNNTSTCRVCFPRSLAVPLPSEIRRGSSTSTRRMKASDKR